jgi:hypothetical protein
MPTHLVGRIGAHHIVLGSWFDQPYNSRDTLSLELLKILATLATEEPLHRTTAVLLA